MRILLIMIMLLVTPRCFAAEQIAEKGVSFEPVRDQELAELMVSSATLKEIVQNDGRAIACDNLLAGCDLDAANNNNGLIKEALLDIEIGTYNHMSTSIMQEREEPKRQAKLMRELFILERLSNKKLSVERDINQAKIRALSKAVIVTSVFWGTYCVCALVTLGVAAAHY